MKVHGFFPHDKGVLSHRLPMCQRITRPTNGMYGIEYLLRRGEMYDELGTIYAGFVV